MGLHFTKEQFVLGPGLGAQWKAPVAGAPMCSQEPPVDPWCFSVQVLGQAKGGPGTGPVTPSGGTAAGKEGKKKCRDREDGRKSLPDELGKRAPSCGHAKSWT